LQFRKTVLALNIDGQRHEVSVEKLSA